MKIYAISYDEKEHWCCKHNVMEFKRHTRRSLSDGLPAKQLAFILFIATSDPFHFPWYTAPYVPEPNSRISSRSSFFIVYKDKECRNNKWWHRRRQASITYVSLLGEKDYVSNGMQFKKRCIGRTKSMHTAAGMGINSRTWMRTCNPRSIASASAFVSSILEWLTLSLSESTSKSRLPSYKTRKEL